MAIPAQAGHAFTHWKSTPMAEGSWQTVAYAVFTDADAQLTLTYPNPGTTKAFYRIQRGTEL